MAFAEIPADWLMLETDSPDGLPQLTGEWLAALPGLSAQLRDCRLLAGGIGGGQVSCTDA